VRQEGVNLIYHSLVTALELPYQLPFSQTWVSVFLLTSFNHNHTHKKCNFFPSIFHFFLLHSDETEQQQETTTMEGVASIALLPNGSISGHFIHLPHSTCYGLHGTGNSLIQPCFSCFNIL